MPNLNTRRFKSYFICLGFFIFWGGLNPWPISAYDPIYEKRAQEVIGGLMELNGLTGFEPQNPAQWPAPKSASIPIGQLGATALGRPQATWDLSRPQGLVSLSLNNQRLTRSADFSGLRALKHLEVNHNALTGLNLADTGSLMALGAVKNQISSIDIRHLPNLTALAISSNRLVDLDLSQNPKIKNLLISFNNLANLNLNHALDLETLEATNNKLKKLVLTENLNLIRLLVSYNQLADLNVGQNAFLQELAAKANDLSHLNLTNNPSLSELNLGRNRLKTIDLSQNHHLTRLYLEQNDLREVSLATNQKLISLNLENNPLMHIELGGNDLAHLEDLNVAACRLPLSSLIHLSGKAKSRARLGNQSEALFEKITLNLSPNEFGKLAATLDLSEQAVFNGTETVFHVLTEKKRRLKQGDSRIENGLITFSTPGTYIVEMTNDQVVSHEINPTTGRLRFFKAKVHTGLIVIN
ncbi:MAG: leucine-rich repeat domain-containing protein [Candidatus Adiutrix sp.]